MHTKKSSTVQTLSNYPNHSEHIVICGFGRVGRILAKFLKQENMSYIGLDNNIQRVKQSVIDDYKVYLADISRQDTLRYLDITHSKVIVVCIDNDDLSIKIVENIRAINKEVPILVRTSDLKNYKTLIRAGANEVVSETVEASMMLVLNMLLTIGLKSDSAIEYINKLRLSKIQ